ncbi:MAG: chloride channel protein [Deltaproteobacteria bacterium]|nr:chloride channel protein [Deltaproteobacteria bacterium]
MKAVLFSKIRQGMNKTIAAFSRREYFFMIVMGGIAGAVGGYGAVGFRKLIAIAAQLGWGNVTGIQGNDLLTMTLAAPPWLKIVIPSMGGLLVGIIVYFFAHEAKGHGVPEVMEAVALKDGRMRTRVVFAKAFASAICIGSGGSVGREGPIVQIGSAISSAIGRLFKISGSRLRIIVACGAAAGIAATFNAPMAGALFSLEIILSELATLQFVPVVVASVIATAVSRHYLGNFPAFAVPPYALLHHSELLLYLILGVFAGVVAYAFIRLLYGMEDFFERWKLPEFTKPAIGGAIVGCIGIFFPQIFGVGYESITQVLRGELLGIVLVGLLIAKILATSITIGSGSSGGIFAPSLFMGAVLGGVFGQIVHTLFPFTTASPGAYALVGMGAVVAGTTRAPITAMLIIFEMTSNYRIILPLMFACTIGLVISARLSRESIYTLKLVRRGVNIYGGKELNVLKRLTVSQVMIPEIELVSPSAPLTELATRMMSSSHSHFFVVGTDNRIQGHISLENLRPILKDYETLSDVIIASDLMNHEVTVVKADESLDMVMQLFGKFELDEVPVVGNGQLVGTVRKSDVIEAYNREIIKLDMASGLATSFRLQQKMQSKQLAVAGGFIILEVSAPRIFVGKSLEVLDLRERFGATVLTIKREDEGGEDKVSYLLPTSSTIIKEGDVLIIFGLKKDLSRFPHD